MSGLIHALRRTGWLLIAAALIAAGCGGGVDTGGTGSFASGPIEGFGSVIVGGVRYDDSAAVVRDDEGDVRGRDELRLGMTVEIEGSEVKSDAAGVRVAAARSIRFGSEIVGRVDEVDAAAGTLVVFGQPVQVGTSTVFDERLAGGLAALSRGDVIEVHGFYNAAARAYSATRIEPRPGALLFRLRGFIRDLDRAAQSFRIAGETIDYAGVADPPSLDENAFVRVLVRPAQVSGRWEAVVVRAGAGRLQDRDEVKLAGRVTDFVSRERFSVNGVPVNAAGAESPDGDVALGVRVSIEGFATGGELVARKVEIETDDELFNRGFTLRGEIDAVSPFLNSFRLLGITVLHVPATRFDDGSADDLEVGRRVEVRGVLAPDGARLLATRIRFE